MFKVNTAKVMVFIHLSVLGLGMSTPRENYLDV